MDYRVVTMYSFFTIFIHMSVMHGTSDSCGWITILTSNCSILLRNGCSAIAQHAYAWLLGATTTALLSCTTLCATFDINGNKQPLNSTLSFQFFSMSHSKRHWHDLDTPDYHLMTSDDDLEDDNSESSALLSRQHEHNAYNALDNDDTASSSTASLLLGHETPSKSLGVFGPEIRAYLTKILLSRCDNEHIIFDQNNGLIIIILVGWRPCSCWCSYPIVQYYLWLAGEPIQIQNLQHVGVSPGINMRC